MINIADVNLYYFLPEFLHICGKMIFNNKFKMIIIFLLKQSSWMFYFIEILSETLSKSCEFLVLELCSVCRKTHG